MLDALEHLCKGWSLGVVAQPGEQVLLQRLTCGRCAAPQHGMDYLGYIFDLNARHQDSVAPSWRQNL